MRKILTASLAVLCLVSCNAQGNDSGRNMPVSSAPDKKLSSSDIQATTAEPTTIFDSMPDITGLKPADGDFIFDEADVLDEKTLSDCNNYAGLLYEDRLINAAVITTDDLHELTPHEYAEKAFDDIYESMGSGMILLINNDTNVDYLYRTGSCSRFITDAEEKNAFFWATKDIVTGDYSSAVLRLLGLGAKCPEHIFDNAQIFTDEQCFELEEILSEKNTNIAVLATLNSTEDTNEEICQKYYDRRFKDEKGIMIMYDQKTHTYTALPEESVSSGLKSALADASGKTGDEFDILCNILEKAD